MTLHCTSAWYSNGHSKFSVWSTIQWNLDSRLERSMKLLYPYPSNNQKPCMKTEPFQHSTQTTFNQSQTVITLWSMLLSVSLC